MYVNLIETTLLVHFACVAHDNYMDMVSGHSLTIANTYSNTSLTDAASPSSKAMAAVSQ